MKKIAVLIIFLYCLAGSFGNRASGQRAPFNRGVNLTNWFQAGSAQQIRFSKYTKKDFEQLKSLGCDVIRLPINLHAMTNGAPDYTLDPLFLSLLDQVVGWAKELGLHLILDNHSFDSSVSTDPGVGRILLKVWPQMARHYKGSTAKLYYEILNEPHGIADKLWNSIQQQVVTAIRKIDKTPTIIVGPASWNSYNKLKDMPVYSDRNLIYTFHFYDPFLFTHQGAGWAGLTDLHGMPFPYKPDEMPPLPSTYKGTWVESSYNNYSSDGTVAKVKALIDIAVKFGHDRNVPIYCGELGVYMAVSPDSDRIFWYGVVRKYLEKKKIAWTSWDYQGSFGLFRKNSNERFNNDLNISLIDTLGLTAPN